MKFNGLGNIISLNLQTFYFKTTGLFGKLPHHTSTGNTLSLIFGQCFVFFIFIFILQFAEV